MIRLKIALSVNGIGSKALEHGIFTKMKEAGIDAVEISLGRDLSLALDYEALKGLADKTQIELWSFHLPFMPFAEIDVSSTDEDVRLFSISSLISYMFILFSPFLFYI